MLSTTSLHTAGNVLLIRNSKETFHKTIFTVTHHWRTVKGKTSGYDKKKKAALQ
jgi:hypothetical protein